MYFFPLSCLGEYIRFILMKMIRSFSASFIALTLVLCFLAATVAPVYAAEPDMSKYLASAFGLSNSDLNNYSSNYEESLPVEYAQNSKSCYVALGGITAAGNAVIDSYATGYSDQVASKLGIQYVNATLDGGVSAAELVKYITNDRTASKAIPKADLISIQLDGASFINSSMNGVVDGAELDWGKYIADAAQLAEIKEIRSQLTAEYAAEYGEKNAQSIAIVLEYMLYESVTYGYEMVKAVQAIRKSNSSAVVLVLGLYNPMRGLSFTANGKTIDIGGMIEQMIRVCNVYLLKQTKDMSNTAFIDISATDTNGYKNEELNVNNSEALTAQLNKIANAIDKQYANQSGHNYIRDQILNALTAPCKHAHTEVIDKREATCQEKGYSGDTFCKDCNRVIKKGSEVAKTPHNYGAWTQTKEPTCTSKGERYHTCTICGYTETKSINEKEHSWDEGVLVQAPDCENEGKMTFTCTVCAHSESRKVDATGHDWDDGVITQAADCKNEGIMTYSCKTCSGTKTEPIAIVDHIWDEGVVSKDPTCKAEGVMIYICTVCSEIKEEVIATVDHAWDEGTVIEQAGCEHNGSMTLTCTTCSETSTQIIPATGHRFGEYASNGDATCQANGTKTAICEKCGAVDTQEDSGTRMDHVYEEGICIFCKVQKPSSAAWWIFGICALLGMAASGVLGFWLGKKKGTSDRKH